VSAFGGPEGAFFSTLFVIKNGKHSGGGTGLVEQSKARYDVFNRAPLSFWAMGDCDRPVQTGANMKRRNIYTHAIDLEKISIKNASAKDFAATIEKIPYRGYEVEDISDGRKIVIVKPGGKQSFGRMRKEDFFVFIYNPKEHSLWQISHQQIYDELEEKSKSNKAQTIKLLRIFERVYNGEEPDAALGNMKIETLTGETPEALLKAYKWIWGQEDVNYPTGKGRAMSWEGWAKDEKSGELIKNGKGLKDLLEKLQSE
jgi:hypothetical protein